MNVHFTWAFQISQLNGLSFGNFSHPTKVSKIGLLLDQTNSACFLRFLIDGSLHISINFGSFSSATIRHSFSSGSKSAIFDSGAFMYRPLATTAISPESRMISPVPSKKRLFWLVILPITFTSLFSGIGFLNSTDRLTVIPQICSAFPIEIACPIVSSRIAVLQL